MKDILYGVKMVILKELDPATQDIKADGAVINVDTAEESELEPVISEGNEEVLRTDDKILAIARTPDLLYGYNLKLKDNTFNVEMASLIEGGEVRYDTEDPQKVIGYDSPTLADGATKTKSFLTEIYVANYEGDSITGYVKVTLNNCTGTAPTLNFAKQFYAPEFNIKAREATKIGKPIKSVDYVDELPVV